jgi:hypothetical protein
MDCFVAALLAMTDEKQFAACLRVSVLISIRIDHVCDDFGVARAFQRVKAEPSFLTCDAPECDRVDQPDVALYEFRESGLGSILHVTV